MTSSWVLQQLPFRGPQLFVRRFVGRETVSILSRGQYPTSGSSGSRLHASSAPITSSSNTSFFTHVLIQEDGMAVPHAICKSVGTLVQQEAAAAVDEASIVLPQQEQRLTPSQLLGLGSIWYMPADEVEHNNNRSPDEPHSLMYKPQRLNLANRTMTLRKGDYLRIHHTPRRFTKVYDQDWSGSHACKKANNSTDDPPTMKPKIIVHQGDGFWIINKPPLVPVHATVDNSLENVVQQLQIHNTKKDYVTTTQRIDINTSGLLVVATKPEFAAYFAQLLRRKTKHIKKQQSNSTSTSQKTTGKATRHSGKDTTNIQKEYKCLVCIDQNDTTSSIVDSWQLLKNLEGSIVRHYLESSDRAPKRFEIAPPLAGIENDDESKWLECLLKVQQVSPLIPIPTPDSPLAQALWAQQPTTNIPPNTKAVCEVEIQLLTGRTHQIRGQLSKLGFPIVGDEHYGGAISSESNNGEPVNKNEQNVQLLALQCCQIGFWDANYEQVWNKKRQREINQGSPSDRWVSAELRAAWWNPHLIMAAAVNDKATSTEDLALLATQKEDMNNTNETSSPAKLDLGRVDLLPPRVQLSPGKHKYVLIKVIADVEEAGAYWFVKSASPKDCGGPYHANVAQDMIEWIDAAGYSNIQVTGGGRIDYDPDRRRAHVYGFSYGFGKGDHARVAKLIEESDDDAAISATYDNSNSLY